MRRFIYVDDIPVVNITTNNFIVNKNSFGFSLWVETDVDVEEVGICYSTSPSPTIFDNKTIDNTQRKYGDYFKGGYICYTGSTNLIINRGAPIESWSFNGIDLGIELYENGGYGYYGSTGITIGTGKINTQNIINLTPEFFTGSTGTWKGIIHKIDQAVIDGYDDWFAPSKDEIMKLNNIWDYNQLWFWNYTMIGSTEYGTVLDSKYWLWGWKNGSQQLTSKTNSSAAAASGPAVFREF